MNDRDFEELVQAVRDGGKLLKERIIAQYGASMSETEYNSKCAELADLMSLDKPEDEQERAELSKRIERLAIMCEAWEIEWA